MVARRLTRRLEDGEREFELVVEQLSLEPGDRKAVVGVSGCGKTTTMDLIALASRPDTVGNFMLTDDHEMEVDIGRLLSQDRQRELASIRSRFFGYVVQSSALFPFLTVAGNVELSQQFAGLYDADIVRHLLRALELPSAKAMPAALSMGQRQRVAVARALAHRPAFLLADEPTASLDPALARRTLDVCNELLMDCGGAMLMITHNRDLAMEKNFEIIEPKLSSLGNFTRSLIDDSSLAAAREAWPCDSSGSA